MKKKIISTVIISAMALSAVFGLVSCNNAEEAAAAREAAEASSRDVYAVSLVSGISYLSENEGGSAVAAVAATARPSSVTDADVDGIAGALAAFENIIAGDGVDQTVTENTSEEAAFSAYELKMEIGLHGESGVSAVYTLYFNESETRTDREPDDADEIEEITAFEGVAVFGEELFVVRGVREFESDGRETESSIEFRTYKNIGGETPTADINNYVQIEKSSELGEYEYEYTFVENGKKIREIEIEYEETRFGAVISFEIEGSGSEMEIKKGTGGGMVIEIEKRGSRDIVTVAPAEGGAYKLVYSNGYEEIVNNN